MDILVFIMNEIMLSVFFVIALRYFNRELHISFFRYRIYDKKQWWKSRNRTYYSYFFKLLYGIGKGMLFVFFTCILYAIASIFNVCLYLYSTIIHIQFIQY